MTREPRLSVFCRCGAQWHGRSAVPEHPGLVTHRTSCGPPITVEAFRALGRHVGRINFPADWTDADCQQAMRAANRAAVAPEER